jgi:AcrR family transcriptional regulator
MTRPALRARQTELTRDLILEALVGLIGERRLADFSVQDVADRAGMSLRTVYRHFASREALLDALLPWLGQQIWARGGLRLPTSADDIPELVPAKFASLEKFTPFLAAEVRLDAVTQLHSEYSARSLLAMRTALDEVTQHLEPDMAEAVVWTIRQICSSRTWFLLHEEGGIDATHAGAAAAWAARLLITALREGHGPHVAEDTP